MQEARAPIGMTRYDAYVYAPDTFPAASPALIASLTPKPSAPSRRAPQRADADARARHGACVECGHGRRSDAAGAAGAAGGDAHTAGGATAAAGSRAAGARAAAAKPGRAGAALAASAAAAAAGGGIPGSFSSE